LRSDACSNHGQKNTPARVETTPASSHPARRVGIAETGADTEAESTNASRSAVCDAATYPPTTLAKDSVNPIASITIAATAALNETALPRATSAAPASVAAA
jgi:hypothetical protein